MRSLREGDGEVLPRARKLSRLVGDWSALGLVPGVTPVLVYFELGLRGVGVPAA